MTDCTTCKGEGFVCDNCDRPIDSEEIRPRAGYCRCVEQDEKECKVCEGKGNPIPPIPTNPQKERASDNG